MTSFEHRQKGRSAANGATCWILGVLLIGSVTVAMLTGCGPGSLPTGEPHPLLTGDHEAVCRNYTNDGGEYQSFVSSQLQPLNSIDINIRTVSAVDFRLRLYPDNGGNRPDLSNLLAEKVITIPSGFSGTRKFDFDDTPLLIQGAKYWWGVATASGSHSYITFSADNPYPDGAFAVRAVDGSWTDFPNYDLYFVRQ